MRTLLARLQALEFEARIFVSFGIVAAISWLSFSGPDSREPTMVLIGGLLGLDHDGARRIGYSVVALLMAGASVLRMWSGSALSSARVMAFRVQSDELVIAGPYRLVRHPIYLADFIAFSGFALCLPGVGVVLPLLLYLHYSVLTSYEERVLKREHGREYATYAASTPRFLPGPRSVRCIGPALRELRISADGFRHNALYLLFVPGFLVSAHTLSLVPALAIGLPAVVDWAVVHTVVGVRRRERVPGGGLAVHATAGDFALRAGASRRRSKVTADILYAQCWEDPEIDRVAFGIRPADTVLTVTSGGCNALAFLVDDPARVIALDLNPYQNYVLELKMAAFRALEHGELLRFLGAAPSEGRRELYARVRPLLGARARGYWDAQPRKLDRGVIHAGRYEAYMRHLRRSFRALMDGKRLAERLLQARDRDERERLYAQEWDGPRWRLFTRALLSRAVQSLLFDRAFFAQLGESFSFGDHFRERIRHAVVDLPLRENPFFCYLLFGGFPCAESLPTYLRQENFEAIRGRLDRIELLQGSCEAVFPTLPEGIVSKFNFTNIFEWMSPESCEALLRQTVRVASDGAVLTYRNLLVPRSRPAGLADVLVPDQETAHRLHERDRSFIYRAYVVERVRKH